MKHLSEPIITHLTDTDVYKFNMMYFVSFFWKDVSVVYGMKNRTSSVRLAEIIPEEVLREQLDHLMTLRFTSKELEYLDGFRLEDGCQQYSAPFVYEFLADFQLPGYELRTTDDGQFDLRFPGLWQNAILWETLAMSTVNHLRNFYTLQAQGQKMSDLYDEGRRRRDEKIELLNEYPGLRFMEFGTRRRNCFEWQDETVGAMKAGLKYGQMTGTSNVWLALKQGLKSQGTQAHELYMAYARLFGLRQENIIASQQNVLQDWWELYGHSLSVALTDTYGTDFFFRNMTRGQAHDWKGLRQDSGNPFVFGRKALEFYRRHGVDPLTKLLVFSDGLDLQLMFKLYDEFSPFFQVAFGWGTNLTNDLGLDPISLVVKIILVMGLDAVKLSDNLAKATGSAEMVAIFKQIFGHTVNDVTECRY